MRVLWVAFALFAALTGGPGAAGIVQISVIGTVGFGSDNLGLFGGVGQSLRGAAYQMHYRYDVSAAIDAGNSIQANGGSSFGRPSPIRQADLTINGTTLSVIDPYSATYTRFLYPQSSQLNFGTGGPNGINGGSFSWTRQDQGIGLALDAPITRIFDSSDMVFSAFQRANAQMTIFSYLSLNPASISISAAEQEVPEPAALGLLGLGVLGLAVRRRKRAR